MAQKWRTVRVFISSTFRDMYSEREWLVKVVFPELRELLEPYRIHLREIDLRWGVTEDQANNDQALELCLDLIDECRPFFVGVLGQRYGWVPETYPKGSLSKYGWIQAHTGKSITALEVMHGVLNDPEMKMQSFFYFREPSFMRVLPCSLRQVFEDQAPEAAGKLQELRSDIEKTKPPVASLRDYSCRFAGLRVMAREARNEDSKGYSDLLEPHVRNGWITPEDYERLSAAAQDLAKRFGFVRLAGLETFGDWVTKDLWGGFTRELPGLPPLQEARMRTPVDESAGRTSPSVDWLEGEEALQERFVESRTHAYVPRLVARAHLLGYLATDDTAPLLLVGPPGSGKSTILACLAVHLGDRRDGPVVLAHFAGASPQSTRVRFMLRRLSLILKSRFGYEDPVPHDTARVTERFRQFVARIPENERAVLIIDALDQLDPTDEAHAMFWLPREFPSNFKVILSCTADSGAGETVRRAFSDRPCIERSVGPLSDQERRTIIRRVPSLSAKTLDESEVGSLLANRATQNPLYLLVALEELRGFGSFEFLKSRIKTLPGPASEWPIELPSVSVVRLFREVLQRLEEDFDALTARRVLRWLACSRHGLSQRELRQLAGMNGKPESFGDLFSILRQLRAYLQYRGPLIDFHHRTLRTAVRDQYLESEEDWKKGRSALIDYFYSLGRCRRKVEELPWQLAESGRWEELSALLAQPEFLLDAWEADEFEVKEYWVRIECNSHFKLVDAYASVLEDPSTILDSEILIRLARLLHDTSHLGESLVLWAHLADMFRRDGDKSKVATAVNNQGVILRKQGRVGEALRLFEEARGICNDIKDRDGLHRVLGNLAKTYYKMKKPDEALRLYREEEDICGELDDKEALAACLSNQVEILIALDRLAEGEAKHSLAEQINRDLASKDGLLRILSNESTLLQKRGDSKGALQKLEEREDLCRRIGNRAELARTFLNKATLVAKREQTPPPEAMDLLMQAEDMLDAAGVKEDVPLALGHQAAVYMRWQKFDKALERFREQEQRWRELGDVHGIAWSLYNQVFPLAGMAPDVRIVISRIDQAMAVAELGGDEFLVRRLEGLRTKLGVT